MRDWLEYFYNTFGKKIIKLFKFYTRNIFPLVIIVIATTHKLPLKYRLMKK